MDNTQELLDAIEDAKTRNLLVVVEGIKDKAALERVGLTNVYALSRTPLYKAVEHVAATTKEAALLVDLDAEGKKLYHRLAQDLQKNKVKIDNTLREALFKTPLRHVEGLDTYLLRNG